MVSLDQAGYGAHMTREFPETAELSRLVEYYWVEDLDLEEGDPLSSWRIVPDTCGHLLFHAHLDGSTSIQLVGARSIFVDVDKRSRRRTVGTRLRPGALALLAGDSADLFTDRSTALGDISPAAAMLEERLLAAVQAPPHTAAKIMRRGVKQLFGDAPSNGSERRVEAATNFLEATHGTARIADVASSIGASPRALRNLMRDHVGIGAKRFARVCRAQHVIEQAQRGGALWVDLALDSGYADQPHLVRDFSELLGESPAQFLGRAGG